RAAAGRPPPSGRGGLSPRPPPRLQAGAADDLDQPARRGGRAATRDRAAQPGRARRQPRPARAVNVRPITSDDFPAVAAFLAEDESHLFGRPSRVGVPDITAWLSGPDLPNDTWLYEEDGGGVAVGWVEKDDGTAVGTRIGPSR